MFKLFKKKNPSRPDLCGVFTQYGGGFAVKNLRTGHWLVSRMTAAGSQSDRTDLKVREERKTWEGFWETETGFVDYYTFSDRGCGPEIFKDFCEAVKIAKEAEIELEKHWNAANKRKAEERIAEIKRQQRAAFKPKQVWR